MARRRTCLAITSSKEVSRLQGYGMRSCLRWSTRCGAMSTLTMRREAGFYCWRVSAASLPRHRWTNICSSKRTDDMNSVAMNHTLFSIQYDRRVCGCSLRQHPSKFGFISYLNRLNNLNTKKEVEASILTHVIPVAQTTPRRNI